MKTMTTQCQPRSATPTKLSESFESQTLKKNKYYNIKGKKRKLKLKQGHKIVKQK